MSETLLYHEPKNLYNRRAAGWVYVEIIKNECLTLAQINHYTKMVMSLVLEPSENIFWEQIRWQIAKFLFRLGDNTPHVEWGIFLSLYESFPKQASQANSVLLKSIVKHQAEIKTLALVSTISDIDNLQISDLQSETLESGKAIPSLAERLFIAIAKNWCMILETNKDSQYQEKVLDFLQKLDKFSDKYPKMVYLIYYRAILRLKLEMYEEAKLLFIPFVQKKQTEFWVWEVLSQTFPNDIDTQIACLSKALLCKTLDKFLVKVRQRMAELLILKQDWNSAFTEILAIVAIRNQNNWHISTQIFDWQNMVTEHNAIAYTNNNNLYKKYSVIAEHVVNSSVIFMGIVWKVNSEKKTAQFFVSENINGGFNYEKAKIQVAVGNVLSLSLNEIKGSEPTYFQVQSAEVCNIDAPENLKKVFTGVLKIVGKTGFVENIFVEEKLIINTKHKVSGMAMRAFDGKKLNWGWKAISLIELKES